MNKSVHLYNYPTFSVPYIYLQYFLSHCQIANSVAIFIKITECIFKPEIAQDALKRKDSNWGVGLRMLPDSATLSSAVHVERAMPPPPPPHQITYWHFTPHWPKSWKKPWPVMPIFCKTWEIVWINFALSLFIKRCKLYIYTASFNPTRCTWLPNHRKTSTMQDMCGLDITSLCHYKC